MTIKRLVNFIGVRDDWSSCQLDNGTIIKSKNSLASIEVEEETKKIGMSFATSYAVIPVEDDRGIGSDDVKIEPGDIIGKSPFKVIQEIINIYDVPELKRLILVRPHLTAVSKTRKFDKAGFRVYQVNIELAIGNVAYPPEQLSVVESEIA